MFCPKCGTQNAETNKFCRKCGKQLPDRSRLAHQAPQSPSFIGQVLDGKYRIDAKLGSGGMGDVYRATRLLIEDSVAIKILHPHLARDPQAAERFRREAVMATKLRHRNVVGIYDVGISAAHNVPFILMELAEGYTLRQMINQHRVLPLDFAVTVTTQICSALDEAHSLGIVHRDIKPENIVANQTTTGWYVKVLDFGIAKLYNQTDGLTLDGSAMGTPQYMSPEQCMGEDLDARSDIYSMGILLYEMLCGSVPFKSAIASAIAVHQVHTPPQRPRSLNEDIHPDVEAVILRSIEKQRELRPQKASLLAQELIRAATGAFKSGFTAVPAAPVAKPNVEPEFGPAESEAVIESEVPKIEESEESGSKKKSELVAGPAEMPLESPLLPSKISAPYHLPNDVSDNLPVEEGGDIETPSTDIGYGDSEAVNLVTLLPDADPADAIKDDETEISEADLDLSGVFEAAELRLDELFPNEQPPVPVTPEEIVIGPEPADQAFIDLDPAMPAIDEQEDIIPFNAIGTDSYSNPLKKFLIPAAIVLAVLLIGGVGIAFVFSGSNAPPKPSDPLPAQPEKANEPPVGMVLVPGGEFTMGSDNGDEYARPAHKMTVKAFYMDTTEVTNETYKKFVDDAKYSPPPDWKDRTFPEGKAKFPVTGVDWNDASAYAKWTGKRLPTEEEWEFAARGTDARFYPWGNEWKADYANGDNKTGGMREVGSGSGKSPFGMLDMAGNAWEWTASDAKAYPGGLEFKNDSIKRMIIRGGYWGSNIKNASAVGRAAYGAAGEKAGYPNTGFRCVKDTDQ